MFKGQKGSEVSGRVVGGVWDLELRSEDQGRVPWGLTGMVRSLGFILRIKKSCWGVLIETVPRHTVCLLKIPLGDKAWRRWGWRRKAQVGHR